MRTRCYPFIFDKSKYAVFNIVENCLLFWRGILILRLDRQTEEKWNIYYIKTSELKKHLDYDYTVLIVMSNRLQLQKLTQGYDFISDVQYETRHSWITSLIREVIFDKCSLLILTNLLFSFSPLKQWGEKKKYLPPACCNGLRAQHFLSSKTQNLGRPSRRSSWELLK